MKEEQDVENEEARESVCLWLSELRAQQLSLTKT